LDINGESAKLRAGGKTRERDLCTWIQGDLSVQTLLCERKPTPGQTMAARGEFNLNRKENIGLEKQKKENRYKRKDEEIIRHFGLLFYCPNPAFRATILLS
jgi:hypothetical protein